MFGASVLDMLKRTRENASRRRGHSFFNHKDAAAKYKTDLNLKNCDVDLNKPSLMQTEINERRKLDKIMKIVFNWVLLLIILFLFLSYFYAAKYVYE